MPATTPNHLFLAWAAQRRTLVDLEDRLESATRARSPEAESLRAQVESLRAAADRLLEEAKRAFHAELHQKGLE